MTLKLILIKINFIYNNPNTHLYNKFIGLYNNYFKNHTKISDQL